MGSTALVSIVTSVGRGRRERPLVLRHHGLTPNHKALAVAWPAPCPCCYLRDAARCRRGGRRRGAGDRHRPEPVQDRLDHRRPRPRPLLAGGAPPGPAVVAHRPGARGGARDGGLRAGPPPVQDHAGRGPLQALPEQAGLVHGRGPPPARPGARDQRPARAGDLPRLPDQRRRCPRGHPEGRQRDGHPGAGRLGGLHRRHRLRSADGGERRRLPRGLPWATTATALHPPRQPAAEHRDLLPTHWGLSAPRLGLSTRRRRRRGVLMAPCHARGDSTYALGLSRCSGGRPRRGAPRHAAPGQRPERVGAPLPALGRSAGPARAPRQAGRRPAHAVEREARALARRLIAGRPTLHLHTSTATSPRRSSTPPSGARWCGRCVQAGCPEGHLFRDGLPRGCRHEGYAATFGTAASGEGRAERGRGGREGAAPPPRGVAPGRPLPLPSRFLADASCASGALERVFHQPNFLQAPPAPPTTAPAPSGWSRRASRRGRGGRPRGRTQLRGHPSPSGGGPNGRLRRLAADLPHVGCWGTSPRISSRP